MRRTRCQDERVEVVRNGRGRLGDLVAGRVLEIGDRTACKVSGDVVSHVLLECGVAAVDSPAELIGVEVGEQDVLERDIALVGHGAAVVPSARPNARVEAGASPSVVKRRANLIAPLIVAVPKPVGSPEHVVLLVGSARGRGARGVGAKRRRAVDPHPVSRVARVGDAAAYLEVAGAARERGFRPHARCKGEKPRRKSQDDHQARESARSRALVCAHGVSFPRCLPSPDRIGAIRQVLFGVLPPAFRCLSTSLSHFSTFALSGYAGLRLEPASNHARGKLPPRLAPTAGPRFLACFQRWPSRAPARFFPGSDGVLLEPRRVSADSDVVGVSACLLRRSLRLFGGEPCCSYRGATGCARALPYNVRESNEATWDSFAFGVARRRCRVG